MMFFLSNELMQMYSQCGGQVLHNYLNLLHNSL